MRRVLVLGCPGSGKTTLALEAGARMGLPVVHLDRLYWASGWMESRDWMERLEEALARPDWIMDGNYGGTLVRRLRSADAVILLDLPRWLCMWQAFYRVAVGFGRTRPDMTNGCPERLDTEFFGYIWRFQRTKMPGIRAKLGEFSGEVTVLRTRGEIRRVINGLGLPEGGGLSAGPK